MSQLLHFYKSFASRATARAGNNPTNNSNTQPTFEDLTIDDSISELERLIKYTKSSIGLQRLVHTKMLADVAKSIGFPNAVLYVIPLLEVLSKDPEAVVRQHLVEQLKALTKQFCQEGEEDGYSLVIRQLLPIIAALLQDERSEVRQAASMTLVDVAHSIRLEDMGQYVLTIILRLSHDEDREDLRMTASQLLNMLAESMGQDLCRQFVIPEVVSLAEDPMFRVRKSTALNFHSICKVGGEHELLERLMPAFVRLSKDDVYRVRRACAESLCDISKCVNEDIRLGVLVEIFLRLTQDPSKLVKQSVLQQSGMFLSTLPSRSISESLLSHYCGMLNNPTGDQNVDEELKHICAFSFPAVLQIIGKNRWKEVRTVYHSLAQSRNVSIKQTLAYSLHEVAKILQDQQLVEAELVPVFEHFIQEVEAVQMGVMKSLSSFLSLLSQPCRLSYLPLLHDMLHSTNPFNWRLRQSLAVQLPDLIRLPSEIDLYRTLFPLVMVLLQDPVASVRKDSFQGVAALVNTIHIYIAKNKHASTSEDDGANPGPAHSSGVSHEQLRSYHEQCLEEVARSINTFILADKYQLRQLWVELAHQLLIYLPRFLFEKHFVQGILALTCDPVINVRVPLAVLLSGFDAFRKQADKGVYNSEQPLPPSLPASPTEITAEEQLPRQNDPWEWLLARPDICTCVDRLSEDDKDVYIHMQKLSTLPSFSHVVFASRSCRGKKTPPGGFSPIAFSESIDATSPRNHVPSVSVSVLSPGTLSVPQLPESMRAGQGAGSEHVIVCESSLLLEEMLLEEGPLSPMPTRPRRGSGAAATAGGVGAMDFFDEQAFVYDDDEDDEDLKGKDDDDLEPPHNSEPFILSQSSESEHKSEESQGSSGESCIRISHNSHSSADDPTPSENIHPPFS
eukprot:gene28473-37423_t